MLQSTDYFNTSHSINTVEETAYESLLRVGCPYTLYIYG